MNEAVDWAVKEDLLDGLISAEKDEVIGMILSEYNEEAFIKTLREDGYDEGLAEGFSLGEQKGLSEGLAQGKQEKAVEAVKSFYANGVSVDIIAKSLGMSQEQVQEIISEKAVV